MSERERATTDRMRVCVGECARVLKFLWVISSSHFSTVALSHSCSLFALSASGFFHVLRSCQLSRRALASSVIFIISYDLIIDYCFECVRVLVCVLILLLKRVAPSRRRRRWRRRRCRAAATNVAGNSERRTANCGQADYL